MPISVKAMTASMTITMMIGIIQFSSRRRFAASTVIALAGVKVRQQGTSGSYHTAEGGGNSRAAPDRGAMRRAASSDSRLWVILISTGTRQQRQEPKPE